MKALILRRPGSILDMQVQEIDPPVPVANQVLVHLDAAGLNPVDYKLALAGNSSWKYPHIPGLDGAGIITGVGTGVPSSLIGSRVCFHTDLRSDGTFAEFVNVPAHAIAVVPDNISSLDAAALPCSGLTAWEAVNEKAHVKPGDFVLVEGAAGGVGGIAVQLAKIHGATVIGTCSPENNDYLYSLGVDYVLDYNTESIREKVLEYSHGHGANLVIETISGHSATQALGYLSYAGHLVCLSGLPDLTKVVLFTTAPSIHEVALGAAFSHGTKTDQEALANNLKELLRLCSKGNIHIQRTRVIPLEAVPENLEALRDRHVRGKIVVDYSLL